MNRYRQQALRRPPSQSWRTFLRNHASSIWAADLFTVQTLAFRTLYVLIVIDHDRRRIRHWNVTEHPNAPWIWQQMIEATAWGQQPGFLIRDRDRSYGGDFIARARRLGIETILTRCTRRMPTPSPSASSGRSGASASDLPPKNRTEHRVRESVQVREKGERDEQAEVVRS